MEDVKSTLTQQEYEASRDFLRVATATPEVVVGDIEANTKAIAALYDKACKDHVALVTFPELSITGYTLGDLVQSPRLLADAKQALVALAETTSDQPTAMVVGLPLSVGNGLYNCAAVLSRGEIQGIVPKQNLPTYKEFYEKRWYQSWDERDNLMVSVDGRSVVFGTKQLFEVGGSLVGVEICEDLWVPNSPNVSLISNGADVIVNPSASPEIAGKHRYRRDLVAVTAGKLACAYVYAGADSSESTMDIVMGGNALINEAGRLLAERRPFSEGDRLLHADIDISRLQFDRRQNTNFPSLHTMEVRPTHIERSQTDLLRQIDKAPFIPKGSSEEVAERFEEIYTVQVVGLAERLKSSRIKKLVLGLSGGLDSTLALLVAERAVRRLGMDPKDVIKTLTMPARASSKRTQSNAEKLAHALGVTNTQIPIAELTDQQLAALQHDSDQDVTFQNTQARVRTALLMNRANQTGALVLGTGDLSEIALGWCTFNGDHMSHYNVNASIPKTLVRHLVRHAAELVSEQAKTVLLDILDTPISPELTGSGDLSQSTEDILGPYELHDFFLYQFIRFGESADKISFLAKHAFQGDYTPQEIDQCLAIFISKFYGNQWKRSVMPDGPKVGTVSLSPRGDWRMPSDAAQAAKRQLQLIGAI